MTDKIPPQSILIPNRGMVAMDIIRAFQYMGLETHLMVSPEDQTSMPVRLADKCYRFFSSIPENSYMDSETIIEKALELGINFLHPGYGFLAENPKFYKECRQNSIKIVGPSTEILSLIHHKRELRNLAEDLGIPAMTFLKQDPRSAPSDDTFPVVLKQLKGSGEAHIRLIGSGSIYRKHMGEIARKEQEPEEEFLLERYLPGAHRIKLPFLRDQGGHTLFLPEIESSIQRRFEEIFFESPSPGITDRMRKQLTESSHRILEKLHFTGTGHMEFMLNDSHLLFSDIDPVIQPHVQISEITGQMDMIQKQFRIFSGEQLSQSQPVHVIKPRFHVMLAYLMAEDPNHDFRPSSGKISQFFSHPSTKCSMKSILYTGCTVSPIYNPLVGCIGALDNTRDDVIGQMKYFMKSVTVKGVRTNLSFLRYLLDCENFLRGETTIDTFDNTCDIRQQNRSEEETAVAAALLAAAFHRENKKKNFKEKLEKMKQPSVFKRLFNRWQ